MARTSVPLCSILLFCVLLHRPEVVKSSIKKTEQWEKFKTLYDYQTNVVVYKHQTLSKCYIERMRSNEKQGSYDSSPSTIKSKHISNDKLSNQQVSDMAGPRVVEFCRGFPMYFVQDLHHHSIRKRSNSRNHRRIRGQTQSQYLNTLGNSQPGKAEAEATADSTKAVVSGSSGVGQAQSQSNGCEGCYGQEQELKLQYQNGATSSSPSPPQRLSPSPSTSYPNSGGFGGPYTSGTADGADVRYRPVNFFQQPYSPSAMENGSGIPIPTNQPQQTGNLFDTPGYPNRVAQQSTGNIIQQYPSNKLPTTGYRGVAYPYVQTAGNDGRPPTGSSTSDGQITQQTQHANGKFAGTFVGQYDTNYQPSYQQTGQGGKLYGMFSGQYGPERGGQIVGQPTPTITYQIPSQQHSQTGQYGQELGGQVIGQPIPTMTYQIPSQPQQQPGTGTGIPPQGLVGTNANPYASPAINGQWFPTPSGSETGLLTPQTGSQVPPYLNQDVGAGNGPAQAISRYPAPSSYNVRGGGNGPTGTVAVHGNGIGYPGTLIGTPSSYGSPTSGTYGSVPNGFRGPTTGNGGGGGDGLSTDANHGDSQVQTSVHRLNNETQASASALGKYDGTDSTAHVSGTYTGSGSFGASAGSNDGKRGARTQISGGKQGAVSSAQGTGGAGHSQAQVELSSETGDTISTAQSSGTNHGTNTLIRAGAKGGMADAQANGPGGTSSQAQIGFTPHEETDDDRVAAFHGGGTANAQGGRNSGQTQVQLEGKFRYGIKYTGSAQAGSGNTYGRNQSQFTFANVFPTFKPLVFETKLRNDSGQQVSGKTDSPPVNTVDRKRPNSTGNGSRPIKWRTTTLPPPPQHRQDDYAEEYPDYEGEGEDVEEQEQREANLTDSYTHRTQGEDESKSNAMYNSAPLMQDSKSRLTLKQNTDYQKQRIVLDPLENLDAAVTQVNGDNLEDGAVIEAGQFVPGSNGYKIPRGYRGVVKSVANGPRTSAIGKHSQAQTVSLEPGTGRILYRNPLYGLASITQTRNGQYGFGSGYTIRPAHRLRSGINNPNFVSLTKSEIGSQDAQTGKRTPSIYYSQSSTCGYFTNTCVYRNGIKICTPRPKANADGTPIVC